MRFEKVVNGILKYLDSEIYTGMNDWQEVLSRVAVARMIRNEDGIKELLCGNSFVRTFAIMDEDGDVDIENLLNDIREQIEKKGKITISLPLLGKFSFNASDVDKLHRMIMEA